MGRMTQPRCIRWQGKHAIQSLGKLEPEIAVALQAHIDGCAEYREQTAELGPLAVALTAASPSAFEDTEAGCVPSRLQESVLHRLETEARQERRRPPGTAATIALVRSWSGTAVTLREHGQTVGRDFVVTMHSNSGTWWQAGSCHTSSLNVCAQLTCAVEPYEITRVWVRDSTGATVRSGYVH
jgi:hypothetical protein